MEEALLASEEVLDAAVVGVPHPYLCEVAIAFVVPRVPDGLDQDAVLAVAREQLSSFKCPRS